MKKYIILAASLFLFSATALAAPLTLWQYFGSSMPSFAQRTAIYADINPSVTYTGSAQQNNALLGYFLSADDSSSDPSITLGAATPDAGAIFQTSLATGILPTDTTMTLVSNALRGGNVLSGYQCFTMDVGLSNAEYMCGTVSGTAVTAMKRGIDPLTATTTNISLEFPHRRGASITITDFPILQILKHQANGEDSYPNMLNYQYDMNYSGASSTAIVSYGLLQRTAIAGGVNSSETVQGLSQLATGINAASSTSIGTTGARLVLPASLATSSPYAPGLYVPITQNNGTLNPNFISTSTTSTYNFGGPFTTTGTTTIATTTITTANIVTANIGTANISSISGNGSGITNIKIPQYSGFGDAVASANSTATTTILSIPSGVMTASSTISIMYTASVRGDGSVSPICTFKISNAVGQPFIILGPYTPTSAVNADNTGFGTIRILANNSTSAQQSLSYGRVISDNGGGSTIQTSFSIAGSASSAFNLSSGFSILAVAKDGAGGSTNCQMDQVSAIVNP